MSDTMNIAVQDRQVNVRAARSLLVQAAAHCARCGRQSPAFALAVPPGHEWLDVETGAWHEASGWALLLFVEYLAECVAAGLTELASTLTYDRSIQGEHGSWVNHCAHCGSVLDDDQLHCEPGAAFLPISPEGAQLIRVIEVRRPFAGRAAGMTHDLPAFFTAILSGSA